MSDVRAQLLSAAHELFMSQGFDNTTIQQLADQVGISKGAVYLHFRSKTDVMMALVNDLDTEVLRYIEQLADDPELSPAEKLHAQLRYQFADVRERQSLLEIYLKATNVSMNEELALLAQKMRIQWQDAQERFIRLAYPTLDEQFTADVAAVLNGALNEYYTYVILEGAEIDPDRVADLIVGLAGAFVERLGEGGLRPVLDRSALPDLEAVAKEIEAAAQRRIDAALDRVEAFAAEAGDDTAREIRETSDALRHALAQPSRSRVVLQGLVANLREFKELSAARKELAYELGLKLV